MQLRRKRKLVNWDKDICADDRFTQSYGIHGSREYSQNIDTGHSDVWRRKPGFNKKNLNKIKRYKNGTLEKTLYDNREDQNMELRNQTKNESRNRYAELHRREKTLESYGHIRRENSKNGVTDKQDNRCRLTDKKK